MLTLTEAAARKVDEIIRQQAGQGGQVYGLRVSAAPGCCSGAQYGMSLAEKAEEGDWEGEFGGVKVLVDPESAAFLQGVSIDYAETPEGSGFAIRNPRAMEGAGGPCGAAGEGGSGCSCGS